MALIYMRDSGCQHRVRLCSTKLKKPNTGCFFIFYFLQLTIRLSQLVVRAAQGYRRLRLSNTLIVAGLHRQTQQHFGRMELGLLAEQSLTASYKTQHVYMCREKGKSKLKEEKHIMFHHVAVAFEMTQSGGAVWHNDDLQVSTC